MTRKQVILIRVLLLLATALTWTALIHTIIFKE